MKGYFRRRGCTCKKKRCTCGSKWSYTLDIGIDPKTGKRKQRTRSGFATKELAEDDCTQFIIELREGMCINESTQLFKDFAAEWVNMYDNGSVKPGTIRIRKHEISRLMDYLAHIKIKDVTRKRYQAALDDLIDRNYADNTVDGAHRTGRMIFKKAVELGLIKKDPTEYARVKRRVKTVEELESENELPRYMEKDELNKFLSTAKKFGLDDDYDIFLTLAYSGLRIGELVALKTSDIDLDENTIRVTKTYYNSKNNTYTYELVSPKTKKSKRIVVMDEMVIEVLRQRIKRLKAAKMKHRDTWHDENFLFAQINRHPGYPHLLKTIAIRMKRLLKIAELNQELTPHSLRHTHTSLLAEAEVGLTEIMDRLGHTDDDTTKNVYLHVTRDKKKEAPQKFSQLLKGL